MELSRRRKISHPPREIQILRRIALSLQKGNAFAIFLHIDYRMCRERPLILSLSWSISSLPFQIHEKSQTPLYVAFDTYYISQEQDDKSHKPSGIKHTLLTALDKLKNVIRRFYKNPVFIIGLNVTKRILLLYRACIYALHQEFRKANLSIQLKKCFQFLLANTYCLAEKAGIKPILALSSLPYKLGLQDKKPIKVLNHPQHSLYTLQTVYKEGLDRGMYQLPVQVNIGKNILLEPRQVSKLVQRPLKRKIRPVLESKAIRKTRKKQHVHNQVPLSSPTKTKPSVAAESQGLNTFPAQSQPSPQEIDNENAPRKGDLLEDSDNRTVNKLNSGSAPVKPFHTISLPLPTSVTPQIENQSIHSISPRRGGLTPQTCHELIALIRKQPRLTQLFIHHVDVGIALILEFMQRENVILSQESFFRDFLKRYPIVICCLLEYVALK